MLVQFDFPDKVSLAQELAKVVAKDLALDIKASGSATLAVSGGNTPKQFFAFLGEIETLDWAKVSITLVDERWVDVGSDRSNARLVKQNLMQGPAAKANFIPLYSGGVTPDKTMIAKTNAELSPILKNPFSAVILGMGNDGHTASFFPKGDSLHNALSQEGPAIAINAPGAGEARVTLTLPTLLKTRSLYLHIEGEQKLQTLNLALAGNDVAQMPVRAVLSQKVKPIKTYWCP